MPSRCHRFVAFEGASTVALIAGKLLEIDSAMFADVGTT